MSAHAPKSKALYERSKGSLIEGGSSPSRGPANYGEYPLFMDYGAGGLIFDVDGTEYVDWMMAYGALPLGHAHPAVTSAVQEAMISGAHFATATEIEVQLAEMLQAILPNAERVRFANTGTEATMAAIRLARGFTGRPKFIKFEGHYHGWFDDFLVNSNPQLFTSLGYPADPVKIPDSAGLNRFALQDTILVPWNDLAALERAVEAHPGQIAAIITEGIMANMGVIPPEPGYLQGLQALARAQGILFILDETVTGFRITPGGCQTYYGLDPDISTYGKALGAGLPVAAFTGRAEIMAALEWGGVLHYGTQNASRVGLHAAKASLEVLLAEEGAPFKAIWQLGEELCAGIQERLDAHRVPAVVQAVGPMFQIMFTRRSAIQDYRQFCREVDRDLYRRFVHALFDFGIYMTPSAALHSIVTLAHTQEQVERTITAVDAVLDRGDYQND